MATLLLTLIKPQKRQYRKKRANIRLKPANYYP
jgi:hypothetical protein